MNRRASVSFPRLYDSIQYFRSLKYFFCLLNVCPLRCLTLVFSTRLASSACSLARQSPLNAACMSERFWPLMRHVCARTHRTLEISWHPWPTKRPAPSYRPSLLLFTFARHWGPVLEEDGPNMKTLMLCLNQSADSSYMPETRIDANGSCLATILKWDFLREHWECLHRGSSADIKHVVNYWLMLRRSCSFRQIPTLVRFSVACVFLATLSACLRVCSCF